MMSSNQSLQTFLRGESAPSSTKSPFSFLDYLPSSSPSGPLTTLPTKNTCLAVLRASSLWFFSQNFSLCSLKKKNAPKESGKSVPWQKSSFFSWVQYPFSSASASELLETFGFFWVGNSGDEDSWNFCFSLDFYCFSDGHWVFRVLSDSVEDKSQSGLLPIVCRASLFGIWSLKCKKQLRLAKAAFYTGSSLVLFANGVDRSQDRWVAGLDLGPDFLSLLDLLGDLVWGFLCISRDSSYKNFHFMPREVQLEHRFRA